MITLDPDQTDHSPKDDQSPRAKVKPMRLYQEQCLEPAQEHYAAQFDKYQVSERELENQCDELFHEAPIPFRPRKGNPLEEAIAEVIHRHRLTLPVIHIRDKLYLIGPNRQNCELKAGHAMIKAGGGYQRFDEYLLRNLRQHQKKLVSLMINNNQSLEWVVTRLMDGQ